MVTSYIIIVHDQSQETDGTTIQLYAAFASLTNILVCICVTVCALSSHGCIHVTQPQSGYIVVPLPPDFLVPLLSIIPNFSTDPATWQSLICSLAL